MILINKIDLFELDNLRLKSIYNSINYPVLEKKAFIVKDISALKSLKLKESLEWLFNAMIENSKFEPIEEVKNNNLV
jgi:translation elongation factor EF-1alpha